MTGLPVSRVALVLGTSGGGMGTHVRMLAAGLADRGAQVTVLGPQSMTRGIGAQRATRLSFGRIDIGNRPRLQDAGVVARLRELLRAGPQSAGPEVVHAHGLRAGALCVMALLMPASRVPAPWMRGPRGAGADAAARQGGPGNRPALVVTVHNAPPLAGGAPALVYRALEAVVARGADVVLCVSGDLEARMRAAGARRVGHAVVPAPRAREAGDQPARDSLAPDWVTGERPVVLGAGRLAPQKGFGILLEAAASWQDMDPKPLVVIAGEGPLAAGLRDQAAALGVDAVFPGRRDDVPELMAAADVIAIPSLWEGQPLVLQEALRSGTPIVATRAGGIPDMAGAAPGAGPVSGEQAEGAAAVLVRPGDSRELASAVRAVLTDEVLAARLRAAALSRAAELPSEADAVDAVIASYADAREHRRAHPPAPSGAS
jgi:glycosyltransferase involved in cell wall biosynthesis